MAEHLQTDNTGQEANVENEERPYMPKPVFEEMAIRGSSILKKNQPVHETMTLAALIGSDVGLDPGMTWKNCTHEAYEYIRGVVWNDDPAGLLYDDHESANALRSRQKEGPLGMLASVFSSSGPKNIIGRSHFGDLQFLHAMASSEGEPPIETKAKIVMWLEIMYKLALGDHGITPDTRLQDIATSGPFQLKSFFHDNTVPTGTATLRLLLGNDGNNKVTKFRGYCVKSRAVGSCFHVIQDGYAYGHVRRKLLNEEDCVDRARIKMRDGIADEWGEVENFHTYKGQNSAEHAHYDHADHKIEDMTNLSDRKQFNGMAGVRDGIEQCILLANFWKAGIPWEGDNKVGQWFSDTVFKLSKDVSLANHDV